jgi:hypothetical protein
VQPARYAGVEVYGRVVLSEDTPAARQGVLDAIAEMIDGVAECRFGGLIGQSSLFAHIESQPYVRYAYGITLSNTNVHAHKTKEGDVAIAPDALAYLAKAELEFVSGTVARGIAAGATKPVSKPASSNGSDAALQAGGAR